MPTYNKDSGTFSTEVGRGGGTHKTKDKNGNKTTVKNGKENYYDGNKDNDKDNPYSLQYLFIWFMLCIWACILTMKLEPGPQKVQNIFLAILCPPIYIIAHYLGFNNNNK